MDRLFGYIILVFALGINLIGFFGVAKIALPTDSEMVSGILSFIGSLLGGLITFLGVRITLEHGVNEKILDTMSNKMYLLEKLINELKAPFNALFFLEGSNTLSDAEKTESYKKILKRYHEILENNFPEIRRELDFDFIQVLELHIKTMGNNVFLLSNSNKSNFDENIIRLVDKSRDIFSLLLSQNDKQIEEYYRIKKRQKSILG